MKKLLIVFSVLLISLTLTAQENKLVKELGVAFSGKDSYGLTFRFGNEQALWRINAMSLYGRQINNNYVSHESKSDLGNFYIGFGREFRKSIGQHTNFRFGADASLTYGHNTFDSSFNSDFVSLTATGVYHSYIPGMNLVLGLSHQIKQFVIGVELQPRCSYVSTQSEIIDGDGVSYEGKMTSWSYGLSNSPVLFTAVYQF